MLRTSKAIALGVHPRTLYARHEADRLRRVSRGLYRLADLPELGNARVVMQVDVGVGDAVYPWPIWIDYPVLLDQSAPHLLAYTLETAIAEKYQAMVELDKANSRMKDFHDFWTLLHYLDFDGEELAEAIRRTFEHRKTELPRSVPTAFT